MIYKPDYKYISPTGWSLLTPLYDFLCATFNLGEGFKQKVLKIVILKDGFVVADIGCGTGVFLKIAKKQYPKVQFIGVDPDSDALAIAERRLAKANLPVELKEGFAEFLPFSDQSINVCFSALAFHHMPNEVKQKAIEEMYRVLAPGGLAVISDFGENKSVFFRKILLFENLEYLEGNFKGLIPQYLKEANFKNIKIVNHHFPGIDIVLAEK